MTSKYISKRVTKNRRKKKKISYPLPKIVTPNKYIRKSENPKTIDQVRHVTINYSHDRIRYIGAFFKKDHTVNLITIKKTSCSNISAFSDFNFIIKLWKDDKSFGKTLMEKGNINALLSFKYCTPFTVYERCWLVIDIVKHSTIPRKKDTLRFSVTSK